MSEPDRQSEPDRDSQDREPDRQNDRRNEYMKSYLDGTMVGVADSFSPAMTIDAHNEAASMTNPMKIEYGRLANVAHFTNTDNCFLPRHQSPLGQRGACILFLSMKCIL